MAESKDYLEKIGKLAVAEHLRWKSRNLACDTLREARRGAGIERGEPITEEMFEAEDLAEWRAMEHEVQRAQRRLDTARAATRRAIALATNPEQSA